MSTKKLAQSRIKHAQRMKVFLVAVVIAYVIGGIACVTLLPKWGGIINAAFCYAWAFWFSYSIRFWEQSERFWKAADYCERVPTEEAYENLLACSKDFDK